MINVKPILGVFGKGLLKEEGEHQMKDFAEEGLKTVGEHVIKRINNREQTNTYNPAPPTRPAPFNASMNKVAENAINSTRRK
jgi:hypothetical protein